MWFVLALGLITLAAAASFARRPSPARKDAVKSFSLATSLIVISSVCLDLAAVGSKIPADPQWQGNPRLPLAVMEGISESLAPAILGFTLLSLVWIVMAIGQRRLESEVSRD